MAQYVWKNCPKGYYSTHVWASGKNSRIQHESLQQQASNAQWRRNLRGRFGYGGFSKFRVLRLFVEYCMGRRICVQVLVGNISEMSAFQWAMLAANATRPWSIIGRA